MLKQQGKVPEKDVTSSKELKDRRQRRKNQQQSKEQGATNNREGPLTPEPTPALPLSPKPMGDSAPVSRDNSSVAPPIDTVHRIAQEIEDARSTMLTLRDPPVNGKTNGPVSSIPTLPISSSPRPLNTEHRIAQEIDDARAALITQREDDTKNGVTGSRVRSLADSDHHRFSQCVSIPTLRSLKETIPSASHQHRRAREYLSVT